MLISVAFENPNKFQTIHFILVHTLCGDDPGPKRPSIHRYSKQLGCIICWGALRNGSNIDQTFCLCRPTTARRNKSRNEKSSPKHYWLHGIIENVSVIPQLWVLNSLIIYEYLNGVLWIGAAKIRIWNLVFNFTTWKMFPSREEQCSSCLFHFPMQEDVFPAWGAEPLLMDRSLVNVAFWKQCDWH